MRRISKVKALAGYQLELEFDAEVSESAEMIQQKTRHTVELQTSVEVEELEY
jgi:uncharacterized alkaline shock family protein YloU